MFQVDLPRLESLAPRMDTPPISAITEDDLSAVSMKEVHLPMPQETPFTYENNAGELCGCKYENKSSCGCKYITEVSPIEVAGVL